MPRGYPRAEDHKTGVLSFPDSHRLDVMQKKFVPFFRGNNPFSDLPGPLDHTIECLYLAISLLDEQGGKLHIVVPEPYRTAQDLVEAVTIPGHNETFVLVIPHHLSTKLWNKWVSPYIEFCLGGNKDIAIWEYGQGFIR